MKRHLTIFKSFLFLFVLIAIALILVPRSTATSDPNGTGSNSPTAEAQDEKGTIVAHLKEYDPTVDGYGFQNYGRNNEVEKMILGAGDVIKIFGAQNVCQSGSTANDCVLYEPVEEWVVEKIKGMEGGHCDGLAMTSLRFWLGLPFKGKSAPGDWQSGAHKVFDLQHTDAISNYVAYYHLLQSLEEGYEFRRDHFKNKPSEILRLVIDSMKDDSNDRLELAIYQFEEGKLTRGHAIIPYAVEDMGDGLYHVHVYDSNYNGTSKYVELNAKEETWRYHTAADPSQTARDYVGDASTKSLTLQNLAARELDVYGCPFCPDNSDRASLHHASVTKKTKKEQVGFDLTGEGEYMITDPNGRRIGYDFARSRFVNEIPDADVVADTGGLGKNIPPEYHLPHISSGKPYTINVGSKSNKEVDADLDMEGPGFVVGFQDILLDPGENLTMTISANGRELSFTASQDGQTPSVFITIATNHKEPSYFFAIGGIKLSPGKTVSVKLDLEKQKLFFKDNDTKRDAYDVLVARVNPDGTKNFYEHHDLEIAKKTDNYEMDFGKWDGRGEMCFEDDDEGNGFGDDQCVEEPNDKKPAKPPEARNHFLAHEPIAALLWY